MPAEPTMQPRPRWRAPRVRAAIAAGLAATAGAATALGAGTLTAATADDPAGAPGPVTALPASWIRAAHITGYEKDTFDPDNPTFGATFKAALQELKDDGGNTAVFVTECFMATAQSTAIDCDDPSSETDATLTAGMQYAESLGLKVALNPHVDTHDLTYRGHIAPSNWNTWWSSYDQMMVHYATLAQQDGASMFYVGTELDSASTCPGTHTQTSCDMQWHDLIAQVRQVFTGTIVYASSIIATPVAPGSGTSRPAYELFPAWDAVDMIGVDAYFELDLPPPNGSPDPGVPALDAAWNSFTTESGSAITPEPDLAQLASQYHKPVFASEIGFSDGNYSAHNPASVCPDESDAGGTKPCTDTVNQQAMTDGYESFFETFASKPWFAGMALWDFEIDQQPSNDTIQLDPRGKQAEQTIKAWWTAQPQTTSTGTTPTTTADTTSTQTTTTTTPTTPIQPTQSPRPRVSHVRIVGTILSFTLNEAATVRIAFKRAVRGVLRSGRCRPARTAHARTSARSCQRWRPLTWTVMLRAHAGTNTLKLGTHVRGHALAPGRYEVTLGALGTGTTATSKPFRIAARPSP